MIVHDGYSDHECLPSPGFERVDFIIIAYLYLGCNYTLCKKHPLLNQRLA